MTTRSILLLIFVSLTSVQAGEPFAPNSMAYVLQADRLTKTRADAVAQLANCGRELVVMDHAFTRGSRVL